MGTASNIERNLAEAVHQQQLFADNQTIVQQQVDRLRDELNHLHQKEQSEILRAQQPLARDEQRFASTEKEFERAEHDFRTAEAAYKKAQEAFREAEDAFKQIQDNHRRITSDHAKAKEQVDRTVASIQKQYSQDRDRLEREIERKVAEGKTYAIKAENARRDVDLLRRRYESARQEELELLKGGQAAEAAAGNNPSAGRGHTSLRR